MARSRTTPVLADVAKLAGVAPITVSRVVNNHPLVTPETRARVQKAIDELGYRSNMAARALASGRSRMLGVVSVASDHYGPAHTLLGIEEAARAAGYTINFVTLRDGSLDELRRAVDLLRYMGVDGTVFMPPATVDPEAHHLLGIGVPTVVTNAAKSERSVASIDQRLGATLATAHLLDLGHRTVHHVAGPRVWFEASERIIGWHTEVERRGCPTTAELKGDWTAASGYEAGQRLAEDPDVTAVFVANDQMALGVMLALREAGRNVPGDVSVVGFDDTPESEFYAPPLTTVRQDFTELGQRCVDLLLGAIDGGGVEQVRIEPTLVVRASTAAPR